MSNKVTIIRNGHVIDPMNNVDQLCDIAIQDGKIVAVGRDLPDACDNNEFDAKGCYVVPGLIDIHVHVYQYCTVLGANPDESCLARGVTTVVDGGSAGSMTFQGLKKFICEPSKTRVLAFLNIACHGLAGAGCSGPEFGPGGENDHLNAIKLNSCIKCIQENRDILVGIKVRLDKNITDNGRTEFEVFNRAKMAAETTQTPLMVHHTNSTIPLAPSDSSRLSCPGSLKKGDIYTHTFHGHGSSIYNTSEKSIYSCIQKNQEEGILFDVGHGQGSFDWKVVEAAAHRGFWPNLISTDLHSGNVDGAAKDLCYVMTKLYSIGMPFPKIIEAVTASPALAIGRSNDLGSLGLGREADITILKVVPFEHQMEDSFGVVKRVQKAILPVAVWRAGRNYPIEKRSHDPTVG